MTKVIETIVSPSGETRVETKGFAGEECRDASKFVEEALGERANEKLTAEFHQSQQSTEANRQRH